MSLPTNIQDNTPTLDPVLDHARVHNNTNTQVNLNTVAIAAIQTEIDALLYQAPAFTSFSMQGQSTTLEVGLGLSGSETFTWGISNSANASPSTLSISQDGSNLVTGQSITSPLSVMINAITNSAPTSHSWLAQATNTESAHFSDTFTINWYWKVYAGASTNTTLTAGQIQALATANLSAAGTGVYSLAAGGYKYFCYPTSMAAASGFTDTSTNLSVTMADSTDDASYSNTANGFSYSTIGVTNAQGIATNYRVYRTRYILGGAITIRVS